MGFIDRLALAWALIVLLVLAGLWAGPDSSLTDMSAEGWWDYVLITGGPWLFLRALAVIFRGVGRRAG